MFLIGGCQSALGQSLQGFNKCLTNGELADNLLRIIRAERFEEVIDFGPASTVSKCPAEIPGCEYRTEPMGKERFPHLDLAIVAFQPRCARKAVYANVLFSRDFPNGIAAEFDKNSLGITNVRMRRWDQIRADGGIWSDTAPHVTARPNAWSEPYPAEDLLNRPSADARYDFMPPYPASVFKILVGLKTLDVLERRGPLSEQLQTRFNHPEDEQNLTQQQYLESMLQWSGNAATRGLVQQLHALGEIEQGADTDNNGFPDTAPKRNTLNEFYAKMGLSTLQMNRTRSTGNWGKADNYNLTEGSVHNLNMTSWDIARLLWLMSDGIYTSGAESAQWNVEETGQPVPRDLLSIEARRVFWNVIEDGLWHEVLSNTELCGLPSGGPRGIPALMPLKWISGKTLRMPFGDFPFPNTADEFNPADMHLPDDITPFQDNAEVRFAMKTGLTTSAGSQIGLVHGIPERGFKRKYIVSFLSNLGSRFNDKDRLSADVTNPCYQSGFCYTKKIPAIGQKIDAFLKEHLE
jgi:hypothetical protein